MTTQTIKTAIAGPVVRIADLAGTFVFALQGGFAALQAHLDPVGVLVLAFVTALGGGIMRDLMIGARPLAAVGDWTYMAIVAVAGGAIWVFHAFVRDVPFMFLIGLDAAGLALFAVAGTQKALNYGIHPFVAIFLGTVGAVGGGVLRDILLNEIPRVLRTDIYATAAALGALVVVIGHISNLSPRATAIAAGLACFALRMIAVMLNWHLPTGAA